jgi:hypothetical protein
MVCLSPESPTAALGSDLISWESGSVSASKNRDLGGAQSLDNEGSAFYDDGKKPILDAGSGAPSVLEQGRELGLASEGVAASLNSLGDEIAETVSKTMKDHRKSEPSHIQLLYGLDNRKQNASVRTHLLLHERWP